MKLIRKIHLWLALPFGIVIAVVCVTGALLLVEKPMTEFLYPGFYDPITTPVSDRQKSVVAVTDTTQWFCTGDCQNCKTGCPPKEATTVKETVPAENKAHEPQGKRKKLPFFENVLKLHRWLLDAPQEKGERTLGKTIVGVSVILFVIDLLTGLVLWWPRNRKVLWNRMTVKFGNGWRRFFYDIHVSMGFWSFLFLLLIALTGLTWSFACWREVMNAIVGNLVAEEEVKKTLFSLHTGTWAGGISQAIYFVTCLVGAALPLTGYYMWWKKRKK